MGRAGERRGAAPPPAPSRPRQGGRLRPLVLDESSELLPGARAHLGALGVVTAVTLRSRPAFRLRELARPTSLGAVLGELEELLERRRHFKLWWWPHTEEVRALCALGGRPHWGKSHFRDAGYLSTVHPMWDRFLALREELDPHGVFLNGHLERVFGL